MSFFIHRLLIMSDAHYQHYVVENPTYIDNDDSGVNEWVPVISKLHDQALQEKRLDLTVFRNEETYYYMAKWLI